MTRLVMWSLVAAVLGLVGCTAVRRPELENVRPEAEGAIRDAAVVFHVAVTGNDANPGTAEAPFASIARAQVALRELKETGGKLPGPVTVSIHKGVYRLSEPLVFAPKDSGTADAPITYQPVTRRPPLMTTSSPGTDW